MEEKRKDLKSSKQRKLLNRLVQELNQKNADFYYLSTSEIAIQLIAYIQEPGGVSKQDRALLAGLSHKDIQMILSLH